VASVAATVAATVVAARVGGGHGTGRFCGGNARKRTHLSRRPGVLSPGPEYSLEKNYETQPECKCVLMRRLYRLLYEFLITNHPHYTGVRRHQGL